MKEKNVVFISKENGTLNKEKLAELFIKAMDIESDVRVYVSKPNYPVPELVIIPRENIHFKLEYYNEVLDDTLRFKADKEVFILRAECRLSDARKYRLRADIPLLDSNTNEYKTVYVGKNLLDGTYDMTTKEGGMGINTAFNKEEILKIDKTGLILEDIEEE